MRYDIYYSCVTHIGHRRYTNQDNFICNGKYAIPEQNDVFPLVGSVSSEIPSVFGVFDGMGGEECGEIAAYIAAKNASQLEVGKDLLSDLEYFCRKTNHDICNWVKDHKLSAMGTTAAILSFAPNGVFLCNIGDSKIFRFCDGTLTQISTDHVSIAPFGVKPPLSQSLGIPPAEFLIEPYLAEGFYRDKDIYLICSDGLTDMVSREEITQILRTQDIERASAVLLDTALSRGGLDNITFILCKVQQKRCVFFRHIWSFRLRRKLLNTVV